jgi:hypothetical protein
MVPVGGVHKNSLRGGLIGPVSARLTSQHCALIGVISQFHWQRIIDLAAKLACIVTGDSCHVAKSLKSSEGRCFYAGTGAAPTYITTHHLGRHANGKTFWWYTVLQKGALQLHCQSRSALLPIRRLRTRARYAVQAPHWP